MQGTGNEAVDKIGQMNITGDVIPNSWNKELVKKGKPQRIAMAILALILYWYRPKKIEDEMTGKLIGFKKKFKSDMLQKSYSDLAESLNEDKKIIQRNLIFLEEQGLIKRHFKTVGKLQNVMFIEIFPEKIAEITFHTAGGNTNSTVDKNGGSSADESGHDCPNGMDESDHTSGRNCPDGMDKFDQTNTENTPKNTTGNFNPSDSGDGDVDIERVRLKVDELMGYDSLHFIGNEDDYSPEIIEFNSILDEIRNILVSEVFLSDDDRKFNFGDKDEPDRKKSAVIKDVFTKNLSSVIVKSYINQYLKNSSKVKNVVLYHIKGLYLQCLSQKSQHLSGGNNFTRRN